MIYPNKLNLPEEVIIKLIEKITAPENLLKDHHNENPCWGWLGRIDNFDRPWFMHNGVYVKARILVYECFYGPLEENQTLVPICLTQKCVNPSHLILEEFSIWRKKIIDLPNEVNEIKMTIVIGEILQYLK